MVNIDYLKRINPFLPKTFVLYRNFFLLVSNTFFFIISLILFLASFWNLFIPHNKIKEKEQIFIITKNQTINEIADNLIDLNIINSRDKFIKWTIRWKLDRNIKTGKYKFYKNSALFDVISKITNAKMYFEKITIYEGLDLDQTADILESIGINKKKFKSLCYDKPFIKQFNITANSLEGYLFPDTYNITYGEDEENIIKMMVNRFFQIIESLHLENSVIYKTSGLKSGLIIASIIEKESKYLPERKKISSVFWNRMKSNWRLDSDVTVRYILKNWANELTKKDLNHDSPYNTRKVYGLPPGPICNPGKSSIEAAFFPEKTNHMFFICTNDDEGRSIFTNTLKEHNKVKNELKSRGKL